MEGGGRTTSLEKFGCASAPNVTGVLEIQLVFHLFYVVIVKLREREGQRVDLGRSLKGHL